MKHDQAISLFNKPKIISLIADVNQGKSMFLYNLIKNIKQNHTFNLYYYGLREDIVGAQRVESIAEIETITNSIIIADEFGSLFDLDNRKVKVIIENSLRLINHNNNVLLIAGVPENFKKFISGKTDVFIFKKTSLADLINGSRAKEMVMSYKGKERGSAVLNIPLNQALVYDGKHYSLWDVPYLPQYDTKKDNQPILTPKVRTVKTEVTQ